MGQGEKNNSSRSAIISKDKSKKVLILDLLMAAAAFGVYLVFTCRRAWLCDDAYITLRTVDNFIHGHGPVWNVGERVQAFTHPFWMFLLSAVYAITHEAYFTTIFLSLTVSLLAVLVLYALVARDRFSGAMAVLALSLSCAFLDYSTSGLENPLTHLLLAVFAWIYFKKDPSPERLFWLSFAASLAAFNRMDCILLYLPALLYSFWQMCSWKNFGLLVLGQVPLFLWELFSIIYYGFPFPNTAYAKLHVGFSRAFLLENGVNYFVHTAVNDPWTIMLIVCGLLAVLIFKKRGPALAFGLGGLLYILYFTYIGGDFMSGRFYTAPVFLAVLLFSQAPLEDKRIWALFLGLGIFVSCFAGIPPWRNEPSSANFHAIDSTGVSDERMYYFPGLGLFGGTDWSKLPVSNERVNGILYRQKNEKVILYGYVGLIGYYSGPKVYVLDIMGLGDPLLARLYPDLALSSRIGHFRRDIPQGYVNSLKTGQNEITDPNLHRFYDLLCQITRGPIWNPVRLKEIVKMNLGLDDSLLK